MFKKVISLWIVFLLWVMMIPQVSAEEDIRIYVSVSGNDANNGTEQAPFATIKRAQEEARKYTSGTMTSNVEVIVGEGVYLQNETLRFTEEDSGNNGFRVIYSGVNYPVISGGKKLTGFVKTKEGFWRTKVSDVSVMRELYVNGKAAYRASTEREITAEGIYDDPATTYQNDGLIFSRDVLGLYENAEDMSFRWGVGWKHQEMRASKLIPHPTKADKVIAVMKQPSFHNAAALPVGSYGVRPEYACRVENAYELLDTPGEFYFNEKTKFVYYYPREGETPGNSQVYAPVLERLVEIKGSKENPVENLEFSGIQFSHATYLLPDRVGSIPGQWSDLQMYDSEEERVPCGALNVEYASHIDFETCIIADMGGIGISMHRAVTDSSIVGSAFYDLGGSAISVSMPTSATDEVCKRIFISNNYITRVSNYYYAFPGVMSYYTQDLTVEHNEVSKVPYTAIGIGWGWSNTVSEDMLARTKILNNRIEEYNMECLDGGAIYVLSRQKDSEMKGNYASESFAPYGAYYFDNGASDFTVENNVAENDINSVFIWTSSNRDIHATNTYSNTTGYTNDGSGTTVETPKTYIKGTPSPEAKRIIDQAGLTAEYSGIKACVPENETYFGRYAYDIYNAVSDALYTKAQLHERYGSGMMQLAQTAVSLAETGTLPGQYSAQKKLILQKRIDAYHAYRQTSGATAKGLMELLISVRHAQKDLEDSLVRYSYEETLQIAEELANGSYSLLNTSAQQTLKNAIESVKAEQTDEYEKLKVLENAIVAFDKQIIKRDIKGFILSEYDLKTHVDSQQKTVTVYAPDWVDLSGVTARVELSQGASASVDFTKAFDLTKPIKVNISRMFVSEKWTIQAEKAENSEGLAENWQNKVGEKPQEKEDALVFAPSDTPYMYQGKTGNKIELDISAEKVSETDGVSLVFLAGSPEESGTDTDRFELKIRKNTIDLYRVENNAKSVIYGGEYVSGKAREEILYTADFIDDIKNAQHILIETSLEELRIRVKVFINDKPLINTLCEVDVCRTAGFFGVYAEAVDMCLSQITVTADANEAAVIRGKNVARGKRVYTECLSESMQTHVTRVTDGVVGGNSYPWVIAKNTETANAWAVVDLGMEYDITSVILYAYGSGGTVQVSNDFDFSTAKTVGTYADAEGAQVLVTDSIGAWRYVRVVPNLGDKPCGLWEMEVCSDSAEPIGENIAYQKPVTVSDAHEWYAGSSLVDGKFSDSGIDSSRWTTNYNSAGAAQECYAIIDLQALYQVTVLEGEVFRSPYTAAGGATVYGSRDGVQYDKIATIDGDGKKTVSVSGNRVFRYIKVVGKDWPGLNWGMWELAVYGAYFGEFDGVSYGFSCAYSYKINNALVSRIPKDGVFSVEVSYTNTDVSKTLIGICAEYNDKNQLISVTAVPIVLEERTASGSFRIPLTVSENTAEFSLFILNEQMTPQTKAKSIKR